MELGLAGKSVIVTGASRGIGFAIADGFAEAGAKVSICGRGEESLADAVARLRRHGGTVHGAVCDVADAAALEGYIAAAHDALGGRLDVLVNNPSGFGRGDDEDAWRKCIDVDLMALLRASWAAVPLIEAANRGADAGRGGVILHTSSISGLQPSGNASYGAIKAAVIHYTTSQAKALAPRNIRVNCLAPGSIEFPGGLWDVAKRERPAVYQDVFDSIPFGRLGRPEEVARAAVFLASDAASWITGQSLAVDGGQML